MLSFITFEEEEELLVNCPKYLKLIGWFKDLPAAILILGALLLILVTALAFPGKVMRVYFFVIPAIPGFLYLFVYLASKKK